MPDDGVLDQPEWQSFERGGPPPSDGGEWLWAVGTRTKIATVQDHGPDGEYRREVRVYRQTTKGNWLRFLRTEEVVAAALRGDDVAQAARAAMMGAQERHERSTR